MLVTIALIAIVAGLLQMRSRIHLLERRIALLETGPLPGAAAPFAWAEPEIMRDAPTMAPAVPEPEAVAEVERPEPVRVPEPVILEDHAMPIAPEPAMPKPARRRIGFEELFGRRLPIWAGGVTLAVAGMLIVKYSIDAGLLSPFVRVVCGLLFGFGLIGGAEAALRSDDRVRDPRVRQALAGAGIASLYASVLVAANLYHLIGPMTAFIGLAAITALAMALSLRFGAPSALLGLVGGLAAPALVGSAEPDVPLLTLYLTLAVGGLCTLSRAQRWAWLGIGALAGGFGWGTLLLIGGALDTAATVSLGLFLILVGAVLPLMLVPARATTVLRLAGAAGAAVQMAALVATGGFSLLNWGLFGLIAAAIMLLSRREPALRRLPAVGVAIALCLLGAWPGPAMGSFALVALGLGAIFAVPTLLRLWQSGDLADAALIAGLAVGGLVVAALQFHHVGTDTGFVLLSLGAALLPAGAAAIGWLVEARYRDARFALLVTTAAALVATAAGFALPIWTVAPAIALIGLALLLFSFRAHDTRLEASGWAFAAAGLFGLLTTAHGPDEVWRALGGGGHVAMTPALVRWAVLAGVAGAMAALARSREGRIVAQAAAALLGYGVAAQVLAADWLAVVPALGLVALVGGERMRPALRLVPALASLMLVSLLWAAEPLMDWSGAALLSLAGEPMLLAAVPAIRTLLLHLAAPAAALLAVALLSRDETLARARPALFAVAGVLATVAVHGLYKHLFALDAAGFVRSGLAERTVWEALLAAAAVALWRMGGRIAALAVAAASVAHFAGYTLLLHDPLWAEQAVGAAPLVNWLLPAYALPLGLLWLAGRYEPALAARFDRPRSIAQMLLVPMLAVSLLRQLCVGGLLTVPGVGDGEDIARSVLMVALGVGYLLWGIHRRSRDWRIGSLLLMLGAAAKVFLFDASGLDGLARIASFVALGFSLIGIGWLYSRYLTADAPLTTAR
ncbi:DUF2339 domain-containing protein [Flavisphingomonas formosensis]|uniref:DUF2339 domain-containing protein n=1 Tax=Flavisphingomonas formosensis TaxID=861534 RepID=UPI0012FB5F77|nr:DUF2339 domain-containing protein [Sphingomonas formosensis]